MEPNSGRLPNVFITAKFQLSGDKYTGELDVSYEYE
jgi:hypothetical protein